jgi:hypothetical protein
LPCSTSCITAVQAFLEARRVRHQVAQRDRLREGLRQLEVDVLLDVGVEIQAVLLDELHHGRPGEQLGRGARPEQRALRVDRRVALLVGHAIPLLEQHLAVLDDGDDGARRARGAQRGGHQAVEPGLRVLRGELMADAGNDEGHGGSRGRGRDPARGGRRGRRREGTGRCEGQDGGGGQRRQGGKVFHRLSVRVEQREVILET